MPVFGSSSWTSRTTGSRWSTPTARTTSLVVSRRSSTATAAVDVSGLPAGVTLSGVNAGGIHTCAVGSNGRLYCWGSNLFGQLGTGGKLGAPVPDSVKAPEDVTFTHVFASLFHTCAEGTHATGAKLYCWGQNQYKQLGYSGTSDVPLEVVADDGVTLSRVSAGIENTCAEGTDASGTRLYCWGLTDTASSARARPAIIGKCPSPWKREALRSLA